jgi:hypothetical protein
MCTRLDFGGSGAFRTPAQEKPHCTARIFRPVKTPIARRASVESAPLRPDLRTPAGGPAGTRTALQGMLVTLLAWTALLCAGLGGTVGVVSQTLAGKLAASVQHLQRHGGSSLSSRAVRRELPAVAAELKLAEASAAFVEVHTDGAVPPGRIALPTVEWHSYAQVPEATEPRPAARHRMPPSRAPPLLA